MASQKLSQRAGLGGDRPCTCFQLLVDSWKDPKILEQIQA